MNMTGPFISELAAVRAGFRAIMADNNKQQYKEFGFWVIMKNKADRKVRINFHSCKGGCNLF